MSGGWNAVWRFVVQNGLMAAWVCVWLHRGAK